MTAARSTCLSRRSRPRWLDLTPGPSPARPGRTGPGRLAYGTFQCSPVTWLTSASSPSPASPPFSPTSGWPGMV